MTTKLTLTVEKKIIERAKIYAKSTGRSLSEVIETYLKYITETESPPGNISPKLRNLAGSVRLPGNFNEKKELDKYYETRHL